MENKHDYKLNEKPFMVIGRLVPKLVSGKWSFEEELYQTSYQSKYQEHEDLDDYIDSDDNIAFLCYMDQECLGHIRLGAVDETKFVSIDRLIVEETARGKGIGTLLMSKAKEWSLQKGMKGFTLETQDTNLLACRFYIKNGFEIGAVDTLLYSNSKYADENAVFLYQKFN